MDTEAAQIHDLLVLAAETDITAISTLHTLFSSGQARDIDIESDHVCLLFTLCKSLPLAFERRVSTEVLDILLTGFSWPETLEQLTVITQEQVLEAFAAVAEAVRAHSEGMHRASLSSTRDSMGLVSMVSTARAGGASGAGPLRPAQAQSETDGLCPAVKQRQARWDNASALRAILLWILSTWPACREPLSQCVVQRLVDYAQSLEPAHAHGIRIHLQALQSILLAEPEGKLLSSEQHARSLLRDLARLREMEGMVSDTASVLGVYHEALVGVVWVLVGRYPTLMMQAVQGALAAWTRATMGTTAAAMLLLHEVQTLFCSAVSKQAEQKADSSTATFLDQVLTQLLPILAQCISSENSRLAQLGLGFFKDQRFVCHLRSVAACRVAHHNRSSAEAHAERTSPSISAQHNEKIKSGIVSTVAALLRHGKPHWNSTVNKQVSAALSVISDLCPEILHEQIEHVFALNAANESASAHQEQLEVLLSAHHPSHGGVPRPGRPHSTVHVPMQQSILPGHQVHVPLHGFKQGTQPPATITGVAPWAMTGGGRQKGMGGPELLQARPTQSAQSVLAQKAQPTGATPQQRYQAYLQLLVPPPTLTADSSGTGTTRMPSKDGAGGWDATLPHWLSRQPVYLPTLAFHDLVFGPELGSGAFATVRYAKAVVRGRGDSSWPEYAVKIISRKTLDEVGYVANARREVAVLSHLTHPNTARMVSSFSWRDGIYLVLEYGSRGDLHTLLTKLGSLDEDSARWLCGEVLAALLAVHDLGLLYCDCKPENVVLVEDGSGGLHAKLTDVAACRPMPAGTPGHTQGQALVNAARGALTQLRDGGWRPEGSAQAPYASSERPTSYTAAMAPGEGLAAEEGKDDERIECTEEYLPPEAKVHAGTYIDQPTVGWDAYAFGVLVYQCLTGRLPDVDCMWAERQDKDATSAGAEKKGVQFAGLPGAATADGFPEDFPHAAKSLVRSLLDPVVSQRLGCVDPALGLRAIAAHEWFTPIGGVEGVQALYSRKAPVVSQGTSSLPADPRWSRRHNSSIWAPLPCSYNMPQQQQGGQAGQPRPKTGRRRAADFTLYELAVLDVVPPL